ncbi:hypothetical protein [Mariniblastus fucicola]|uniref:DUF2007 domain-containing protein n=1 Tax=Mariniblastus fucicola TaxID=980251 RepID=A0A5B9P9I1_9BACT|nr:hypothetical protein [Mariniblastus fucicola]QEG21560.1 hypothetical protein MFFC18_14180 [Mariniblastus fucicola]
MEDPAKPVSVAVCATVVEADVLRNALEEQGVFATLDGAALNTTFGFAAGPVISGVKILVRQEDADDAAAIIQATRDSFTAPTKDPWFCGKCLEEVEGGFDVCWSCGLARAEVQAPFPATADAVEILALPRVDSDRLGRQSDNPYESPRAIGLAERDEEEVDPDVVSAESQMILGMLFAIGCLLIPVLPGLAAIFVFHGVFRKRLPLSWKSKFTFWFSVFILVTTHLAWLWVWQVSGLRR